ncbi:response regulator [Desulfogranum japonicum]|uniref:response regulator n=1 Tax=Desulfogranum japonicum TaxID=231447 RepID=UPI00042583B3|nr:response regulator [Desulfogranum japonicum]
MHDSQNHIDESLEQTDELLSQGEVILLVDDFPDIVDLIKEFLDKEGMPTITAGSAAELHHLLTQQHVALVLLDIGLPDADGKELIPVLKETDPDLSIIMLTAVNDLQTALSCLRHGADDYLAKPVHFADLLTTLRKVLEKRRLKINNRRYQRQIEQARFRIQLAHELAIKMNTAYLSLVELDEILQAVLVGITADEGLQFNRAFLLLFDEEGQVLKGRMAIGPGSREDGGRIWNNIRELDLGLHDLLSQSDVLVSDSEVNRIVKSLRIPAADEENIFIRSVNLRKTINVVNGQAEYPVSIELMGQLQEESFVIVPLYSSSRSLGVLIADHFVSHRPITEERIKALESFASQASLAIEHCHLYMDMERKIKELQAMAEELEKNKDLLVEAERYSAVGHMAAQLAHNIRNPITSIGGTARLLSRKTDDPSWLQFLNMMTSEAEKIERTLEDLFNFVEQIRPEKQDVALNDLLEKSLLLHYQTFTDCGIHYKLVTEEGEEPRVFVDPRLFQQVMVHLIRNSVEAMPSGGELVVRVEKMEEYIQVSLRDTGIGLTSANLEHATDPFYTTKTFGTGMGLALVKRIIEDHQGNFYLQDANGGGTEAIIRLPL